MNSGCVMAQYEDIIYMNVWFDQRSQRVLFQLLLQLYQKEIPKNKRTSVVLKPMQQKNQVPIYFDFCFLSIYIFFNTVKE